MPGQKECTIDEAIREVELRDLIISTKGRSQFTLDVGNNQDGNEKGMNITVQYACTF